MDDLHPQQMRQRMLVYALLLLFFYGAAYLLPLGVRDLVVPDETRYAEIPREMIASGDWAVPHLNGLRYFEKPVLGYWVHAGAQLLFGQNNFAVRLPSALAIGLSALLIFLMVKTARWGRQDEYRLFEPVAATLIFLSCAEVVGVGNTAVLDNLLALFLTFCIAAFYHATESTPGSAKEKGWLLIAGILCGLAFLTKGFLAFVVPVLVLGPYLLWQRRYADILRMSWLPIIIAVVVVSPWALRIHLREPDFWNYFFWDEHIRRFASQNAQHEEAFWYFLLAAPGVIFPWTFMIPAAVAGLTKLWREQPERVGLLRLCLCWMIIPFLFFSVSSGKLLTYILPCFPPFSILMGLGLLHALQHKSLGKLFQGGAAGNGLLFGILLIALVIIQLFGFGGFRPYNQFWQIILIASGLFCALLFCWRSYRNQNVQAKILYSGMALIFIYFIAHYTIPDKTKEVKCPGKIIQRNLPTIADHDMIISDEEAVGAACWYLRRNNIYVLENPGELAYGLKYRDAQMRSIDLSTATELIRQHHEKVVLIARAKNYERWRDKLPQSSTHDQNGDGGYVVIRF